LELTIETVATGWQQVLSLFSDSSVSRIATRHGISFDVPGLTLRLANVNDLTSPVGYLYPELIKDYRDRLFGDQRSKSMFYQRMRRWDSGVGPPTDQLTGIEDLLKEDPNSRSAVFSTWLPHDDLGGEYPVSPVGGCFRLIAGVLYEFVIARSVDVWVGLVPELLTFAQLGRDMALTLGAQNCTLVYHSWSAHLYEIDYLSYVAR
jgi:thymidylate synthase